MKPLKRCTRIQVEVWTAPGGPGHGPWPDQSRTMEGRCVEYDGHEGPHVMGDWRERD